MMHLDVVRNTWLIVVLIIVAPSMDGEAYYLNTNSGIYIATIKVFVHVKIGK